MRLAAVLVSLFLTFAAVAQQPLKSDTIDRAITTTQTAWKLPGIAVAIVRNDRVIYAKGFGVKDLGSDNPVTADTTFQIASNSKAFTTAALAMLVDDGKLSWDDPVRQYVDYFRLADPCAESMVTVRDTVSHRTGLSRHDELWDNAPWSREEVLRKIGQVKLNKPFRTAYQYNNIMFIAAGEVVSHAANMPWDDFVRTRLFQPLGMNSTFTEDAKWQSADHATGYRYDWKKERISMQPPIDTNTLGAAGAIKSTARDMAQWVRLQLNNGVIDGKRLISEDALNETKMPQTVIRLEKLSRDTNPESNVMAYGMGWNIQDYRGELLVSHGGALNGFRSHVDLLPRRGTGFVILTNVGRGMANVALRNTLIDILLGYPRRDWNAYYLMVDRKADEADAKEIEERNAKRIPNTQPSHPLADYAGEYESPAYGTAIVTLVDNALVLQWSRMHLPLTHFHYDVFNAVSEPDDVDEQVTFGIGAEGKVKTLTFFGETFTRK
ncbi:MAG TPA: serine hydrolase [Thermoanaerobaculia bacterium]|nr:serine hydrolase [Thermoanaerobaculia bacterium]